MMTALALTTSCAAIAYAVGVFASWSTFRPAMPFTAALGLRRVAFRTDRLVYVSRGPLLPTAVFWFGGTDDQAEQVAKAMADGRLPRREYGDIVDSSTWRRAYESGGRVWPDEATLRMFGDASVDHAAGPSRAGVIR